jgi:hypothetical protein
VRGRMCHFFRRAEWNSIATLSSRQRAQSNDGQETGDLRRWSRGGIHIDVPEDRLYLLGASAWIKILLEAGRGSHKRHTSWDAVKLRDELIPYSSYALFPRFRGRLRSSRSPLSIAPNPPQKPSRNLNKFVSRSEIRMERQQTI